MNDLSLQNLLSDSLTLVVVNGEDRCESELHGIAPLMNMIKNNSQLLKGAMAADKVVGRAAALLFVYGGISKLYARTISDTACVILDNYNIEYTYEKKVPYIMNRKGDGMCPMEECVYEEEEPTRAYHLLTDKINSMMKK